MSQDNNGTSLASFLAGFIIGGFVGAVTALLLAPQSGEETRTIIREKSIELQDKASTTADEWAVITKEKAAELEQRGQVILEEQKSRMSAKRGGEEEVLEEVEVVAEVESETEAEE